MKAGKPARENRRAIKNGTNEPNSIFEHQPAIQLIRKGMAVKVEENKRRRSYYFDSLFHRL